VQLLEDRLDVALDGAGAEVQLLSDRPVRASFCDQGEDAALALGEIVERRAPMPADEALHDL
jgi:hypothetical protein